MFGLGELDLHVVQKMMSRLTQDFEYRLEGGEILYLKNDHVRCEEELVVTPAPGDLGVGW